MINKIYKTIIFTLVYFTINITLLAQIPVGPNNPANTPNTFGNINHPAVSAPARPTPQSGSPGSPGNVNWLTSDKCQTSNNEYATVPAVTVPATASSSSPPRQSRLMFHKNFGFSISTSLFVQGIQVEYEKKTISANVEFNNNTPGNRLDTGFIFNPTILPGKNRTLMFAMALENGGGVTNRLDIITVNFANQVMALRQDLHVTSASNAFNGRIEVYTLDDVGIANAISSGQPLRFNVTYNTPPVTLQEDVRLPLSGIFNNVDQISPLIDIKANGQDAPPSTGSGATALTSYQLATPLTTNDGGLALIVGMAGLRPRTNPAPGTTNVSFNSITTYTDAIDVYDANTCCPTSGCCLFTANKFTTGSGTEQPTIEFLGAANRILIVALQLQRARELDRNVYLIKNNLYQDLDGPFGSANLAQTNLGWPQTDTYFSHGGPNNKWSQAAGYYTIADVNSNQFGTALGVTVQNGDAFVDHVRMTVYTSTTLPIDLISFTSRTYEKNSVQLNWETLSEINNKVFDIERSIDGVNFNSVSQIEGAGDSKEKLTYTYLDKNLPNGIYYYRLKQTDVDGKFSYSSILSHKITTSENPKLTVYPNPSSDGIFNTVSNLPLKNLLYAVYDENMKLLRDNVTEQSINLSQESDGTYYLVQQVGESKIIQRLMKFSKEK